MFYKFIFLIFCSWNSAEELVSSTISCRYFILILLQFCQTTDSLKYHIKWPTTSTKTVSNPLCLSSHREFLYRDCVNGFWGKEPTCAYIQPQKQPQCPENFVDTGSVCYIFSNPSKFPVKCPFEDVLPFDVYKNEISKPVWMPIRKDATYGVFYWVEASSLYKTPFEDSFYLFGSSDNKDCLLFYNTSYIVAVSCNEEHFGVCAYPQFESLDSRLCGNKCQRSDFSQKSKCFCKGDKKNLGMDSKVEFIKPYQHYNKANCTFGLKKSSTGYIWVNSQKKVEYTFWSNGVIFDQEHIYGAITSNGWLLTTQNLNCILYEKSQIIFEPSLNLNLKSNVFTVSINNETALKFFNEKPLIYCFSNSKPTDLIHRYEFDNGVYEFFREDDKSGEYWCEAFKYSNMERIQSNKVVIQETVERPEFIGVFKFYNILQNNCLNGSIPSLLFQALNRQLHYMKDYNMRIMKILNMNTEHKSISVNVRFNLKCSHCNTTDVDEEYINLKTNINAILNNQEAAIVLEDLRPFGYCLSYQEKILWPKTEAGSHAEIKDFCFVQGLQIQRQCLYDFVDGAQWSTESDCELMEQSPVTNALTNLQNEASEEICFNLRQLVQDYGTLKIIDLYLIENIIQKCVESDEEEMLLDFLRVYDTLMSLEKTMLEQAELKTWVTSTLLYTFFYPFYRSHQTIYPLVQKNFVYTKSQISTLIGIALQKNSNKLKAIYLTRNDNIEDIVKIQNFDSMILLNPDYCDSINQSSSVSFSIFSNNVLFIEDKTFSKNPRKIFSASFDKNKNNFEDAIWVILRKNENDKTDYMCAIWTYGDRIGWWKVLVSPKIFKSFYFCKFPAQSDAYYSLINLDSTLTDELNELIQCDCSATELLERLQEISDNLYSDFTSRDVYFAAMILEKVTFSDDFDLEMVVTIMSNLEKINTNILQESEMTEGAVTLILNHFSVLQQKYNLKGTTKIERPNFMFFGSLLKNANVYGLVKFDDNLDTVDDDNLSNIFTEYFDVVILLSAQLRAQLNENDKIIITIFESSTLFQSSSTTSPIGTIIGVHLPLDNYTGPIYIFHKLSEIQTSKCVSWSHNTPDVLSSWQIIAEGEIMSDLITCKIWNNSYVALITNDDNADHISLDLVTTVNSGISFIALSTLAITYDKKNVFLFYVAINNIFHLILLDFSKRLFRNANKICTAVTSTSVQHSIWIFYAILATLLISQNKSLVSKMNDSKTKFVFSWFCSLLPISISWLFNNRNCFGFKVGLYLYIWHPVSLTFAINSFILSHVSATSSTINNRLKCLFRVALILLWILGLFASIGVYKNFCIYLLSCLVTLQGVGIAAIILTSATNYTNLSVVQKSIKQRI